MRIDAAPPRLLACLVRSAGWLYSGFVALISKTADAELRVPSFDVIVGVIVVLQFRLKLNRSDRASIFD